MLEHVNGPDCDCFRCVNLAMSSIGFCVVHMVAEPEQIPPASARGSNLCPACEDRMGKDLRLISTLWAEVEAALTPDSGGGTSERHAGRIDPPSPIDMAASHALRVARDAVCQVASDLVDSFTGIRLPDEQSTPDIAEWLSRSHVLRISSAEAKAWTRQCYWKLAHAADALAVQAPGGATEVPTPHACRTRIKNLVEDKEVLVACGGELLAVERSDGVRSVRCGTDAGHSIPWDTWSQMMRARKPRGARVKGFSGPR